MTKSKTSSNHKKSTTTIFLDIVRNIIILIITGYLVYLIWKWSWIVAIIGLIPVYIVIMNLVGFITLPLYTLTPESKLTKEGFKEIEKGNIGELERINSEFDKKFGASDSQT